MLPLHHRTICINLLSISSSPSYVTPNHRVSLERSKCVVSRYCSKELNYRPPPAGVVVPQGFEPWLTEPKPVVLAITPWDKSFYYRQTPLSSFVSAKVERKNQTTKHFAEKFLPSPSTLGAFFCFRVLERPGAEALSSETFMPWYSFEVEKSDPPQGWYVYIQRTHLFLACRSCVAPDGAIMRHRHGLGKFNAG